LAFPAKSLQTPEAISTVTAPSAMGVISNVYILLDPAKLLKAPFPIVISSDPKPVTSSLNVTVTGIVEVSVVALTVVLIRTVGEMISLGGHTAF